MKNIAACLLLSLGFSMSTAVAAPFDARAAFDTTPGRDVDAAIKRAAKEKKRVILFAYSPKQSTSGGNYPGLSIKYFTDLQETKKLLKANFIIVLLEKGHKDLERFKPAGNTERDYWVVISSTGDTVKADTVYGNPDEGLKIVKELIGLP